MPRRLTVIALVAVAPPLLILSACNNDQAARGKNTATASVPVNTARAEKRSVPVTLRTVGSVESIASVAVVSRVDGQILKVLVQDGQEVAKDQPLVQVDPAPLAIQLRGAEAALARDQAKLENAQVRAEHGSAVMAQHFISADEYTQLKTDFESAKATVDADRAARDNAALQLDYATIRAPVAGKLGHIALQVGNMLHANVQTPLTTLNVLDPIDVSFAVPEQNIAPVRAALHAGKVDVHASVTDSEGGQRDLIGKLTFVDNAIDSATGTIRLRARFDNATRALWPGQFVTTSIALSSDPNAIVVPASAIQHGPAGTYVYVVDAQSNAEQRTVQVLRTTETDAMVIGVAVDEQVVTDGQSRLTSGSHVALSTPQRLVGAEK
jgi:multidrug efflux system membrane fusion protein